MDDMIPTTGKPTDGPPTCRPTGGLPLPIGEGSRLAARGMFCAAGQAHLAEAGYTTGGRQSAVSCGGARAEIPSRKLARSTA